MNEQLQEAISARINETAELQRRLDEAYRLHEDSEVRSAELLRAQEELSKYITKLDYSMLYEGSNWSEQARATVEEFQTSIRSLNFN